MSEDRRRMRTPPQGLPAVSKELELETPLIVDDPNLRRSKSDTDPAAMLYREYQVWITQNFKRFEYEVSHLEARVNAAVDRVREQGENAARYDERLHTLEEARGDFQSFSEFREWAQKRIIAISGLEGTNGTVGNLKATIEEQASKRFQLLLACFGLISFAGAIVIWAVSSVADFKARIHNLEEAAWHTHHTDTTEPELPR